ncbi:MAG: type II secretion system F family protein [bacterium]|nr:type II secretion system F family protein [bacterium]
MFGLFSRTQEKAYVLEELALLLGAGVPVLPAIDAVASEIRDPNIRRALVDAGEKIGEGSTLSAALSATKFFPADVIALIRIGEETGHLPENLDAIARNQERMREFQGKITAAVAYPIVVLVFTVVVSLGTAWFMLPRLSVLFSSLHLELPLVTRILVALGNGLSNYGLVVVPLFLVSFALFLFFFFLSPRTNRWGQWLLLRTPVLGELLVMAEISRFGSMFAELLSAGLPVVEALGSLERASSIHSYRGLYHQLAFAVNQGYSVHRALSDYPNINALIPVSLQHLLSSGEASGQLPETLEKVSRVARQKAEITAQTLTATLEPMLLVFVWLGVLFVAVAVLLPLYGLIGGLNR